MGDNTWGQLGDGTTIGKSNAVSVLGASNVVAMAAGYGHSLFLRGDGTLWAMGRNVEGQLGDGTTSSRSSAVPVASNVVVMAGAYWHSLYLKSNGTLWAMGGNADGQLGDGTTTQRSVPVSVATNVVAVAAGGFHSLYLKSDGTLWAMGNNTYGQLGDGTAASRSNAVSVASNVVALAAGQYHTLYLKSDGTLWAMGYNNAGQLGDGTALTRSNAVSVGSNVVAVASGSSYSLFLKSDGTLWAMGNNGFGSYGNGTTTTSHSPVCVPGMSLANIISGSVANHTLAVGVLLPPVITSQPTNQTVVAGSNVTFTVTATGFAPLSYQWQFNGTNLSGATTTNYSLTGVMATNAGNYTVVVTNAIGSVTSSVAVLTVAKATPSVTSWPTATAITNSQTLASSTLSGGSASVGGTFAFSTPSTAPGAGTASQAVTFTPTDTASYNTVSGSVSVNVPAPPAGNNLYNVQFSIGTRQTGAAVVGSSGDYWNLMTSSSGSSSLQTSQGSPGSVSITWSADGIYNFASSFGGGDAALMGGYLYANSSHVISFSGLPASKPCMLFIYSQSDASGRMLSVTINGSTYTTTPSAFPTYFIAGQNFLAITGIADGSGNLSFAYNSAATEADLDGIQLGVANTAPSITAQPTNQVVAAGGQVNLIVTPTGTGPFYYQWFKNGGMILGATNSTLTFASAGVTNSGTYYVVITNACGMSLSQPATVTVGNPQLLAWGWNNYSQLGDGTTANKRLPESIAGNVAVASAGADHSLFVKGDGTLWGVGFNGDGELGDGTTVTRSTAVSVASNVVAVAGAVWHSLFVTADGTLWTMGQNLYGQLGDGTTSSRSNAVSVASNVVAVAGGNDDSLFLKADGTLWAMGQNSYGQLGDGTTTDRYVPVSIASNVVALAVGYAHSLFLKTDGTLWAMGLRLTGLCRCPSPAM
jgi:alpha-tubulin suppressor-like RCC1 family protein